MAVQIDHSVDGYSELPEQAITELFVKFVTNFQKVYKDDDEAAMRFEIFRRNLKHIDEV